MLCYGARDLQAHEGRCDHPVLQPFMAEESGVSKPPQWKRADRPAATLEKQTLWSEYGSRNRHSSSAQTVVTYQYGITCCPTKRVEATVATGIKYGRRRLLLGDDQKDRPGAG